MLDAMPAVGVDSARQWGDHRFCVAPMMNWTDRHCRYFLRLITRHARLYTEMITTGALIHGADRRRYLRFHPTEAPLALQVGGVDPGELAFCARLAEDAGFDEINLNVGCPSGRVQNGGFGACLMEEPDLVADCVYAMRRAVTIPVTVKCRIGTQRRLNKGNNPSVTASAPGPNAFRCTDSLEHLERFIATVAGAGCTCFIPHARVAVLEGLSPGQNREMPPLRYERVFHIKERFPDLEIVINGGIRRLSHARDLLRRVDGVMVGREAYQNPYFLAGVDRLFFGCDDEPPSREEIIDRMLPYVAKELQNGTALNRITRHLMGLFQGVPGSRRFRRYLSEHAHRPGADLATLLEALSMLKKDGPARMPCAELGQ